jgi:hypothetical protein
MIGVMDIWIAQFHRSGNKISEFVGRPETAPVRAMDADRKLCSTARTKHEGQCHLHSCDIPAHFECLAANWQYDSLSIEIPLFKGKYRSPSTAICSSGNPYHG